MVVKPVLCFHYGANGVRNVDPTRRCHQSNIMPHTILSLNIAQSLVKMLVLVRFVFLLCVCVCVRV